MGAPRELTSPASVLGLSRAACGWPVVEQGRPIDAPSTSEGPSTPARTISRLESSTRRCWRKGQAALRHAAVVYASKDGGVALEGSARAGTGDSAAGWRWWGGCTSWSRSWSANREPRDLVGMAGLFVHDQPYAPGQRWRARSIALFDDEETRSRGTRRSACRFSLRATRSAGSRP